MTRPWSQQPHHPLESRREGWEPLPPKYTRGVLGKYAKVVQSAAHGAVCG